MSRTEEMDGDIAEGEAQLDDRHYRRLLDATGEGVYSIDTHGRCTYLNRAGGDLLGWSPQETLGRNMHELIHHTQRDGSPYPEEACPIFRAFRDGRGVRVEDGLLWRRDGSSFPARFSSYPILEDGEILGAVVTFADVSERREAEAALRESEERFRMMADVVPDMLFIAAPDGRGEYLNPRFYEVTGMPDGAGLGMGWLDALHPDDRGRNARTWLRASAERRPYEIEYRLRTKDGAYCWFVSRSRPLLVDGEIVAWYGSITDIDAHKRLGAELQEQTTVLERIQQASNALSGELELQSLVQRFTDIGTEVTGAAFGAFFYNVIDDRGEKYMLYTLSGVPREAFQDFPMPRNTHVFAPTFAGEGVLRLDDVTRDPRYGRNDPHYGMPEGHLPVRSYLAVPVVSRSGEVLGGLFFGHPEPGVFTEKAEYIMTTLAVQAAVAIDNARLYEESRRLNERLEQRVEQRTAELGALNRELEAFNYSVSHDLRAPLRGIAGFTAVLDEEYGDRLDETGRRYLQRVQAAALRMDDLIEALLTMSQLTRQPLRRARIDLSALAREIAAAHGEERPERAVEVRIEDGLVVEADERLLRVALDNLIGNAWKYTRDRDAAVVEVGAREVDGRRAFFVRDNGVGFDPAYATRLFVPFQRLHPPSEFEGSGVGLATVQRIVHRHGGEVWAEATPGGGATFWFSLEAPPYGAGARDRGGRGSRDEAAAD